MKPNHPFVLSLSSSSFVLLALYLAAAIDTVTGLNLNLYGYGREPLLFAVGTVIVAGTLCALGRAWLGMIGLVFCCAWLALYPAKNGLDVVLSPLLVVSSMTWLWQKYTSRK